GHDGLDGTRKGHLDWTSHLASVGPRAHDCPESPDVIVFRTHPSPGCLSFIALGFLFDVLLLMRFLNGCIQYSFLFYEDVEGGLSAFVHEDKVSNLPLQTNVRNQAHAGFSVNARKIPGV